MKILFLIFFLIPLVCYADEGTPFEIVKALENDVPFETVKALDSDGNLQEYPTGYIPDPEAKRHSQFRDFQVLAGEYAVEPIPLEYSLKEFVPIVARQTCGSCWANGAASAFGTLIGWADKVSVIISVQQIIDCSGYGSCGGGNISLGNFVKPKGLVLEEDYPTIYRNQRCKSGLTYHQSVDDKPFYIKPLNLPNLQRAIMETGPLEVCGSASALGNGGWVSRNSRGSTNHCYAMVGWYDGASHAKPPGIYGIILNSWGTNWGDGGFGYYLLAKDGSHLDGSVITEAAGVSYKPACTPQPSANAGPDQSLILGE